MKNPTFLLTNVCLGVSILLGIINWKRLDMALKVLVIQLATALITQVTGWVYHIYYTNNTFIYNIYIVLDLWLIGLIALCLIQDRRYRTILVGAQVICTSIIAICIWKMGITVLANWGYLSSSILFTMTYLFLIVRMLFSADATSLTKRPHFWMCVGILIYYGGNVPLFGFFNYMIKNHPLVASKAILINDFLNIIRYSFMGVALFKQRQIMLKNKVSLS